MEIISGGGRRRQNAPHTQPPVESLQWDRVIGPAAVANNQTVAHNPAVREQLAYCAGCFAVVGVLAPQKQQGGEQQLLRSGTSNRAISCLCWSSSGDHLAAGEAGPGSSVLVWRLADSSCVQELRQHKHGVTSLSFSPDGKLLVSAGTAPDSQLCVWDWRAGSLLWKQHAGGELSSAAFTEDGSHLLAVGKAFKAWSVSSTPQQQQGRAKPGSSNSCTLTLTSRAVTLKEHRGSRFVDVCHAPCQPGQPAGSNGVYALTEAGVLLLMRSTARCIDKAVNLQVKAAFGLAAAPQQVAAACAEGVVRLFSAKTLAFRATLPRFLGRGQQGPADAAGAAAAGGAFPDALGCSFSMGQQEQLVVAYADHSVIVWNVADTSQITCAVSLSAHAGCIWDICPAGSSASLVPGAAQRARCATAGSDSTIRFWDLGSAAGSGSSSSLLAGVITAGGAALAGPVQLRCMRFSPDQSQLLAGDQRGNLHLYDTATLKLLLVMEAHDDEVLCLDYACNSSSSGPDGPGGCLAASGSRDGLVHIFVVADAKGDMQSGLRLLETLDDHSAAVTAVRFVGGGKGLISCGADRSIIFRVLGGDAEARSAAYHVETLPRSALYDLALDPLEQYVLSTGQDGQLRQWEVASGALARTLQPELGAGEPIRVRVDPGGVVAISCHADGCLRLYSLATGQLLYRAWGHGDGVAAAAVTPDLTRLVSVGGDGCIIVWRLPEQLVAEIKAAVARVEAAKERLLTTALQGGSTQPQQQQPGEQQLLAPAVPRLAWPASSPGSGADEAAAADDDDDAAPAAKLATPADRLARSEARAGGSGSGISSALLRIRQGRPLVSTDKLPKWARSPASPGGSTDDASPAAAAAAGPGPLLQAGELPRGRWGPAEAAAPAAAPPGSKWAQSKLAVPGALQASDDGGMCRLSTDSASEPVADGPSPALLRSGSGAAAAPSAGGRPQLLDSTLDGRQLQQDWPACWPQQADMLAVQDGWDGAAVAFGSTEVTPADEDALQAESSDPQLQLQQELPTQTPGSMSDATPGVVRDLFKQHFSFQDNPSGLGPAAYPDHRQSLSTIFKHRASLGTLAALRSQLQQEAPGSSPQAEAHPNSSSGEVAQSSSQGTSGEAGPGSCQANAPLAAAAAGGEQLPQPERRWRHGKMDAELAGMRQRLASLQALYQQQLQENKLSPRRGREAEDASQQQNLARQGSSGQLSSRSAASSAGGASRAASRSNSAARLQRSSEPAGSAAAVGTRSPRISSSSSDGGAAGAGASSVKAPAVGPPLPSVPKEAVTKLQLASPPPSTAEVGAATDAAAAAVDGSALAEAPLEQAVGTSEPAAAAEVGDAGVCCSSPDPATSAAVGAGSEQHQPGRSDSLASPVADVSPDASPAASPAAAAAATSPAQHNSWLAQLLCADSPEAASPPAPACQASATESAGASAAGAATAAAEAEAAATQQQGRPRPVVALQRSVNSSDSDVRISIGTTIAARDGACSSRGASAAGAGGTALLELSLSDPLPQEAADADVADAAAADEPSAVAEAAGTGGKAGPVSSGELLSEQPGQEPAASTPALPPHGAHQPGSSDGAAAAGLVVSQAAARQGVSITPLGQHVVWPGWGPAGVWDNATPSPASTTPQLLGLPWSAAAITATAAEAAEAAIQQSAAETGAAAGAAGAASEAGTLGAYSSSAGGGGGEAEGQRKYWVSHNPCYDMTPGHSTPGSACTSSRNNTWTEPGPAAMVSGTAAPALTATQSDQQQQPQQELQEHQADEPQVAEQAPVLAAVCTSGTPDGPAGAAVSAPGQPQQQQPQQGDAGSSSGIKRSWSLLKKDRTAAKAADKAAKAAAKAEAAAAAAAAAETDDDEASGSPGTSGMLSLLQRMKKTLPSLSRSGSRSQSGSGAPSRSHSEPASPTCSAGKQQLAGLSWGRSSQCGAVSILTGHSEVGGAGAKLTSGGGGAINPLHGWGRGEGQLGQQQQGPAAADVAAVSELDIHLGVMDGDASLGGVAAGTAAAGLAGAAAPDQQQPAATAAEPGSARRRRTAAELAASVGRFKQAVQEMQQLWQQLHSLAPADANELQLLLTPPPPGSAGAGGAAPPGADAAGADVPGQHAAVTPVGGAVASSAEPACFGASSSTPGQQQPGASPEVVVRQRLQDELLHTIWELHATVTGGLPAASTITNGAVNCGGGFGHGSPLPGTPGGSWSRSPLQPRVLHADSPVRQLGGLPGDAVAGGSPAFSFGPGLAAGLGFPASPAWQGQPDVMEDLTARICAQFSDMLLHKLDERKKAKAASPQLPAKVA